MSIKTPWTAAELVKFAKLHNLFSDTHAPSRERENAARRLEKMLRAHGCNTDLFHDNPNLNEMLKQATEALEEADRHDLRAMRRRDQCHQLSRRSRHPARHPMRATGQGGRGTQGD